MYADASRAARLDSIKTAAASLTDDMMSFYGGHKPGGTPGLLPNPYYCEPPYPHGRLSQSGADTSRQGGKPGPSWAP